MQKIDENELAEILAVSEIITSTNHASMLIHEITHPSLGRLATIQGSGGGGLIITGESLAGQ